MSLPSNLIVPALGSSCRSTRRAVVVLPQPDSPISPNVSPGCTAKSTPSTAFTQAVFRPSSPCRMGKYFCKPSTSSSGVLMVTLGRVIDQPASRHAALDERHVLRLVHGTARHGHGTARVEGAAR